MPAQPNSSDTPEFQRFWEIYPRRTAKGLARKEFAKAIERASVADVMSGLRAQIAGGGFSSDPRFIPHPSTWLHQDRFEDDVASAGRTASGPMEWLMREAEGFESEGFGPAAIEAPGHV